MLEITEQYYPKNQCGNPKCDTIIIEKDKKGRPKTNNEYAHVYYILDNGQIMVCAVCKNCYNKKEDNANDIVKHFMEYRLTLNENYKTSKFFSVYGSRAAVRQAKKELI